jgi:hypothetical protein
LARRYWPYAAIDGRAGLEISAIVFDTRSGFVP